MVNDTSMILFFLVFFVGLGALLPFVQTEFNQTAVAGQTDPFVQEVGEGAQENTVGIVDVLLSIIKMFFWTFGDIPFFMDVFILLPMRLTFAFLLARNIWIGGGA